MKHAHAMPFGAEVRSDGTVRFRLWAPAARRVDVCLDDRVDAMTRHSDGWYELVSERARAGSRYRYRIDDRIEVPDPASRFNPEDVHGSSEVVDPRAFEWQDDGWTGRPWADAVIYELHVGALTPRGDFEGVIGRLPYLAALGISAIELMPVADFPGRRNWGYDGVLPFAPDASYGRPDDLKRLIQIAHRHALMIFLDVVYNHFGPEGNYLNAYAPQFFSDRHHTRWGEAINFDGDGARTVRDFFVHNALYWLEEYRLDGLRFDAVDAIRDTSTPDVLEEIAAAVHAGPGRERAIHLVLENDDNAAHYLGEGHHGYQAQWNDDFHHALHLIATGETDGYYADYADRPLDRLGRCLAEGFDYQGECSAFRNGRRRGEPSRDLPPTAFVCFLQNHDQIGNRAFGERIGALVHPIVSQSLVAIVLLAPHPPLLFMGEEFGAGSPFQFFCDFEPGLADAVTRGRRAEFSRFARFADAAPRERIPDPNDAATFERSKLDWEELELPEHAAWLEFYRKLLAIRRREITPRLARAPADAARYQRQGERALRVDWLLGDGSRLTLLANLGDRRGAGVSRPAGRLLFATPQHADEVVIEPWSTQWFLEDAP